ncbi:MAG: cytochrome c maturation protein CcmE [Bacteroidia bacterium]|nr:cytochrome c maturation protein CcmE [Bacteroidia bacterium]
MKPVHIIILVSLSVALMIILSLYGDTSEYVTFGGADSLAKVNSKKEYHIVCRLDRDKEMVYNPQVDPNYFSFYASDSLGEVRKIVYLEAKPQDLERTDRIVVVGKSKGDHFLATDILKKCPSKYESKGAQTASN